MSDHPVRVLSIGLAIWLLGSTPTSADQYAFLVAVREYDPAELTPLTFTENDITALAETLKKSGYAAENVVLMTQTLGAKQTRWLPISGNIRKELTLLLSELTANDSVLLAFSGHGVQFKEDKSAYFCPADARLTDKSTLVSLGEVYKMLGDPQTCKARTKLLIVDACRNDPQSKLSKAGREVELAPAGLEPTVPPGGIAAFFSCSPGQKSFEHPDLGHGVFLNYVIEGLNGQADLDMDREITLAELEQFSVKQTQRYVRTTLGKSQTPERLGEARGLMTLARLKGPQPLIGPFSSAAAKAGQAAWAKHLGKAVVEKNSLGMELTLIPPGEFLMGSPATEADRVDDETQHRVQLTKPFRLAATEVTQAEYEQVMGTNPSWFSRTGGGKAKLADLDPRRFPVEQVSWYDAVEFCNKLGSREGLPAYYELSDIERKEGLIQSATVGLRSNNGYRLPTEAEWEYACRAGTTSSFHFGEINNGREANVDGNNPHGTSTKGPYLERTTTVGSYGANGFGLRDMHGDVWEWCSDWYYAKFYDQNASVTINPNGPVSGDNRVLRGGSWLDYARYARSAYRYGNAPVNRNCDIGFRVSRTE